MVDGMIRVGLVDNVGLDFALFVIEENLEDAYVPMDDLVVMQIKHSLDDVQQIFLNLVDSQLLLLAKPVVKRSHAILRNQTYLGVCFEDIVYGHDPRMADSGNFLQQGVAISLKDILFQQLLDGIDAHRAFVMAKVYAGVPTYSQQSALPQVFVFAVLSEFQKRLLKVNAILAIYFTILVLFHLALDSIKGQIYIFLCLAAPDILIKLYDHSILIISISHLTLNQQNTLLFPYILPTAVGLYLFDYILPVLESKSLGRFVLLPDADYLMVMVYVFDVAVFYASVKGRQSDCVARIIAHILLAQINVAMQSVNIVYGLDGIPVAGWR